MVETAEATPIPITEVPMQEARTQEEIDAAFERMMQDDEGALPGFIIRASGVEAPEGVYSGLTASLDKYFPVQDNHPVPLKKDFGIGDLHADQAPGLPVSVHVHETIEGQGYVKMANSGPSYGETKQGTREEKAEAKDRLNNMLINGAVDPSLMSPTVHSADFNTGDRVVFRVSGQNPVLHRFDTTSEEGRTSIVHEVHPGEEPVPEKDLPEISSNGIG